MDPDGRLHHAGLTQCVRTEEERALLKINVDDLDAEDASFDVVRSVRLKGKLKTVTSKRGLVLCEAARESLKRHFIMQERDRETAGALWTETGLVFTTVTGGPMDDNLTRKVFGKGTGQCAGLRPG